MLLIGIIPLSDLWFLYALAVFYIIRVITVRARIKEEIVFLLTIFLSLISISVEWNGIISQSALPRVCKYLNFYSAGLLFLKFGRKEINKKTALGGLMFICGLIGLTLSCKCSGVCRGAIELIVAYCNIGALLIAGMQYKVRTLQFFGMKSLYIFLVHDYAVCAIVIITRRFLDSPYLITLLATIAGIWFSLFVIWICSKINALDYFFKPHLLLTIHDK